MLIFYIAYLQNEYKKAMETGGWHRRLEFPGNVVIVMHSANVIVQFPASATPDEWGNVQVNSSTERYIYIPFLKACLLIEVSKIAFNNHDVLLSLDG